MLRLLHFITYILYNTTSIDVYVIIIGNKLMYLFSESDMSTNGLISNIFSIDINREK